MQIKQKQCQDSAIFFKEFRDLQLENLESVLGTIDYLIANKKYKEAIDRLNRLIDHSLDALDYYHKYNKLYLG